VIRVDLELDPQRLRHKLERFWALSAQKIELIERHYPSDRGAPVFTVAGRYTSRGWTEWTQGFQHGSALLQFDATGEERFLELGRTRVLQQMTPHLSHAGVHDHGFNNVSTYGTLLRLMGEGRIEERTWERRFYELALQVSGAVQARRWTPLPEGGFIYSFNGPHSLFVDTIRSCRVLMLAHLLGHTPLGESDVRIRLVDRALMHLSATARHSVYYGEGRDIYDVWGRTAHESIFNVIDGSYRCPSSQQGYSPFSVWTRGLAWAMCGFSEELELLDTLPDADFDAHGGRAELTRRLLRAARATSDFYIDQSPACGVPYWDSGAPSLWKIERYRERAADPNNPHEPVDSSAAAIAAQGLLRLGSYLSRHGEEGRRYYQAGLTVLHTLLDTPYLSSDPDHQGLLLHSIYHRPNGWDYVPRDQQVPAGESSMWGDYHLREVALYVQRELEGLPSYSFFAGITAPSGGS
jgi:unsaturated chondroitin disaccharide hydrolase